MCAEYILLQMNSMQWWFKIPIPKLGPIVESLDIGFFYFITETQETTWPPPHQRRPPPASQEPPPAQEFCNQDFSTTFY